MRENKTHQYLVIRHGANSANQPLTNRAAVEIVVAPNQAEAKRKFGGSLYANQYLEAVPESRARKSEWNAVVEVEGVEL